MSRADFRNFLLRGGINWPGAVVRVVYPPVNSKQSEPYCVEEVIHEKVMSRQKCSLWVFLTERSISYIDASSE